MTVSAARPESKRLHPVWCEQDGVHIPLHDTHYGDAHHAHLQGFDGLLTVRLLQPDENGSRPVLTPPCLEISVTNRVDTPDPTRMDASLDEAKALLAALQHAVRQLEMAHGASVSSGLEANAWTLGWTPQAVTS